MNSFPKDIEDIIINYKNQLETVDYTKMKIKELKAECKTRGLKKYSKLRKAELIALLQ